MEEKQNKNEKQKTQIKVKLEPKNVGTNQIRRRWLISDKFTYNRKRAYNNNQAFWERQLPEKKGIKI